MVHMTLLMKYIYQIMMIHFRDIRMYFVQYLILIFRVDIITK